MATRDLVPDADRAHVDRRAAKACPHQENQNDPQRRSFRFSPSRLRELPCGTVALEVNEEGELRRAASSVLPAARP